MDKRQSVLIVNMIIIFAVVLTIAITQWIATDMKEVNMTALGASLIVLSLLVIIFIVLHHKFQKEESRSGKIDGLTTLLTIISVLFALVLIVYSILVFSIKAATDEFISKPTSDSASYLKNTSKTMGWVAPTIILLAVPAGITSGLNFTK